jgi:oligopeptidase B
MSKLIAPVAKRVPYTHKYHGREFEDPYHWMKDMDPKEKRPEIVEYLKEENHYAEKHFEKHADLTKKIYDEMVSRIQEDDQGAPYFKAPYYYYHRTEKGKQYPIYCRKKDSLDAKEEIIFNQNEWDHDYQDLGQLQVSPDHSILAYSMDYNGSENYQIFFKDLHTGKVLDKETIPKASSSIVWAEDGKSVFYLTLDEIHRSDKVYRHTIGVASDSLVFHEKDQQFSVHCFKSQSSKFIFVVTGSSETRETWYLDAAKPNEDLKLFQKRDPGHQYEVEHQGDRFLVLTNGKKQFLNNRLCSCPLDKTSEDNWVQMIPYDPYVHLTSVIPFKNHIACFEKSDALIKLRILQAQNGVVDGSHQVDIPFPLYSLESDSYKTMSYDSTVIRFEYTTPVSQAKVIEYDMATKSQKILKENVIPNFNPDEYALEMIYAPIPDEFKATAPFDTPVSNSIPISIMYKKSLFKTDGTNPLYLYGYGSYGISIETSFKSLRISLADRGFVTATAHIRGGGDNGRAWYETGKYKNKKNTFHDFITAGKKLFADKYSSPHLTAIDGRSAGGLLIGAVLNMQPDMCKVAMAGVPFVDVINTMMDPSIPLTVEEYEEWGNPNKIDYFDYMLSYSPYENIPKDKKFPDLLVKAGLFDPRVQYWEPTKWVAKLRSMDVVKADSPDPSVIVYDCKLGSGHFGSTGRYAWIEEIAKEYAFMVHRILGPQTK